MTGEALKQRVANFLGDMAARTGRKRTMNEPALTAWENEQQEELKAMMPAARAAAHFEMLNERYRLECGSELWEREGITKAEREIAAHKQTADRSDSLSFGWGHFAENRERHAAAKTAREQSFDDDLELGL